MPRHPTALILAAYLLRAAVAYAEPQPGDIFREHRYTSEVIIEVDPDSKQQNPKFLKRRSISFRERSVDIYDLEDATRAEIALELWGGHVGTSGQKLRINGGDWLAIPEIEGTPTAPQCYHRTRLGSVNLPIAVAKLKAGRNVVEFRAGKQICHSFDWGIFKVYAFTVRVYYNDSKPRADGRVVAPAGTFVIGDLPQLAVTAHGTDGIPTKMEFTKSSVARVDFVGLYDDYNWEGDGAFRRWHYQLELGELRRHIGSAPGPTPDQMYRVTWDNRWIPDQPQPMKLAARITDSHGIVYMTPAVDVTLARGKRSVKLYRASEIPEDFGVRIGKTKTCTVEVTDDPGKARAARLVLGTWAGAHAEAIGFNGKKAVDRVGRGDDYSYDSVSFDPKLLKKGKNAFYIFSNTEEHAAEVSWPGPAVLLEFATPTLARR